MALLLQDPYIILYFSANVNLMSSDFIGPGLNLSHFGFLTFVLLILSNELEKTVHKNIVELNNIVHSKYLLNHIIDYFFKIHQFAT